MSAAVSWAQALDFIGRVVERRNTIPILSNVKLDADGKGVKLTATDLDNEATLRLPLKTEPFSTTVEVSRLRSVVNGGTPTFAYEKPALKVGADPAFMLGTLPADEYPTVSAREWTHGFKLPNADLSRRLKAVMPAVSSEEPRYYLMGTAWEAQSGKLHIYATDGHRLHMTEIDQPDGADSLPVSIVPKKTTRLLIAALELFPDEAEIGAHFGALSAEFQIGPLTIKAKLIDGTYPDVRRVIPSDSGGTFTCSSNALRDVAKATGRLVDEKAAYVRLNLKGNSASAESASSGKMTASLPGRADGALPDMIGFRADYVAAICEAFGDTTLTLGLTDAASPTLFTSEGAGLRCVLMPVRI